MSNLPAQSELHRIAEMHDRIRSRGAEMVREAAQLGTTLRNWKRDMKHGEWQSFLSRNETLLGFGYRTAAAYMQAAKQLDEVSKVQPAALLGEGLNLKQFLKSAVTNPRPKLPQGNGGAANARKSRPAPSSASGQDGERTDHPFPGHAEAAPPEPDSHPLDDESTEPILVNDPPDDDPSPPPAPAPVPQPAALIPVCPADLDRRTILRFLALLDESGGTAPAPNDMVAEIDADDLESAQETLDTSIEYLLAVRDEITSRIERGDTADDDGMPWTPDADEGAPAVSRVGYASEL